MRILNSSAIAIEREFETHPLYNKLMHNGGHISKTGRINPLKMARAYHMKLCIVSFWFPKNCFLTFCQNKLKFCL